jgi:hypothetical protein
MTSTSFVQEIQVECRKGLKSAMTKMESEMCRLCKTIHKGRVGGKHCDLQSFVQETKIEGRRELQSAMKSHGKKKKQKKARKQKLTLSLGRDSSDDMG